MVALVTRLMLVLHARFKSRVSLEAENVVLRQQLLVLNRRSPARLRLRNIDRLVVVWLYRLFPSLLDAIIIVKPEPHASTPTGCLSEIFRRLSET